MSYGIYKNLDNYTKKIFEGKRSQKGIVGIP